MPVSSFHDRAQLLLGDQWRSRLALALLCTPQRFSNRPQPIVVAVLELLEFTRMSGVAESDLPLRWIGRPAAENGDLRTRFEHALGKERLTKTVCTALGVGKETVRLSWSNRRRTPRCSVELTAIVELLEVLIGRGLDRRHWPARWQPMPLVKHSKPNKSAGRPLDVPGRAIQARFAAALGSERLNVRLASAFGVSPDSLARIWREERDARGFPARAQPYLVAAIELLETLVTEDVPIDRWPTRWQTMPETPPAGRPRMEGSTDVPDSINESAA